MTDFADQHISAFADDDLSTDECNFLVRRLGRDADARRKLLRYATIGAALRGELLSPDPDVLRRRINAALEGVHVPARIEPRSESRMRRIARPAVGMSIAAGVAAVALIAVSTRSDLGGPDVTPVAAVEPAPETTVVEGELLPSYVVPLSPGSQPFFTFTDYLVHHNQFAPAIRRASISSTVVGEQHMWRIAAEQQPLE